MTMEVAVSAVTVAVAVVAVVVSESLADEAPAIHLEEGNDACWKCQAQIKNLADLKHKRTIKMRKLQWSRKLKTFTSNTYLCILH